MKQPQKQWEKGWVLFDIAAGFVLYGSIATIFALIAFASAVAFGWI